MGRGESPTETTPASARGLGERFNQTPEEREARNERVRAKTKQLRADWEALLREQAGDHREFGRPTPEQKEAELERIGDSRHARPFWHNYAQTGRLLLEDGETITIQGVPVRKAPGPIRPGDTYVGGRNVGLDIHVCSRLGWWHAEESEQAPERIGEAPDPKLSSFVSHETGERIEVDQTNPDMVFADPPHSAYPYNWSECVKVELVED